MPRYSRKIFLGEYYHVMTKGNADQTIFEDDKDRETMLDIINLCNKVHNIEVYAYCLMGNHMHLLIHDKYRELSKYMRSMLSRYAVYFNKKYERKGALFNGRFKSVPINDNQQLLNTLRYIHTNPDRAQIDNCFKYKWSSIHTYLEDFEFGEASDNKIVNTKMILGMLKTKTKFIDLIKNGEEILCIDDYSGAPERDEDVIRYMNKKYGLESPKDIVKLKPRERNEYIKAWRYEGIPCKQIARLTGIGLQIIYRAC